MLNCWELVSIRNKKNRDIQSRSLSLVDMYCFRVGAGETPIGIPSISFGLLEVYYFVDFTIGAQKRDDVMAGLCEWAWGKSWEYFIFMIYAD